MHYPFWYVPGLTSPMWIAVVAVLHIYTAMYAVGGSIILVAQTRLAYTAQDRAYLEYLRNHAWFFRADYPRLWLDCSGSGSGGRSACFPACD